jgi:diguanylate cyclase (GGDEF)-like protein
VTERNGLPSFLAHLSGHELPALVLVAVAQITLVLVVVLDFVTGPDLSPALLYLVPLIFVVWTAGMRWGLAMAVAVTLAEFIVFELESPGVSQVVIVANTLERLVFYVIIAWLIGAQRSLFEEQRALASTDALTGLMNRRAFFEEGERVLERDHRAGRTVACLFVDLDGLKEVNDRDGHRAGDRLIGRFVAAAQPHLRLTDLFARVGGDEFVVLLPETDRDEATEIAERLLDELARAAGEPPLSASVGVAVSGPGGGAIDGLVRDADEAMYAAKRAGGHRLHLA